MSSEGLTQIELCTEIESCVQPDCCVVDSCDEVDTLALAQEAARSGLIKPSVLSHLTSLHPQVPNPVKHRYLLAQLHEAVEGDSRLFARMIKMLLDYKPTLRSAVLSDTDNTPLRSEDISRIVEYLVRYSYKWRFIGTALEFQPHDLDNIQANHAAMNCSIKQNLIKLLEDWILKVHEHILPPTVWNLHKALNSTTVELGALAEELKTSIAPMCSRQSAMLPYCVVKLSIDWSTTGRIIKLRSIQNTSSIHVKKNLSILLEIQIISERAYNLLNYKWCVSGVPLIEGEVHTGTNSECLCISCAKLDMDGSKYSCKISDRGDKMDGGIFRTAGVVLRVGCSLDEYSFSIASLYSSMPEVPKDTWPPVSSKKYVNLALIKQDQINFSATYAQQHCTIRGDMDDILQQKDKIEYDEVFSYLQIGQVVFVEGRPGCGKTTFVHKVIRDWAIQITDDWSTKSSGSMRLALLVSLRVLNDFNKPNLDLSDILNFFKDLKVDKGIIEECSGEGVCFIFDGLDEFSPPDGAASIVYAIINKTYLIRSTVIVASRPAATANLRHKADKVIEVLGFQTKQVLEYFDYYPFSDDSKATQLKVYLGRHPNILHMCYLPIHAAMVAFLFEVTGEIPKTETEIYAHFTRFTVMRNLAKNRAVSDIDVHNLCGEEKELFNEICQLAL